jgi:flavin-binding protein dodecin
MSKRPASLADAFDRADELAHDLGLFRVAEVQVVGRGQGPRAHGGQVAVGFRHRLLAALITGWPSHSAASRPR